MEIIPVIDLKEGAVVHARQGQRETYVPIVSPLCKSSTPRDVVAGYLTVFPFATLYVADLDAIQGRGDNHAVLADLRAGYPDLRLWVDRGLAALDETLAWCARDLGAPVIGSESQRDTALIAGFRETARDAIRPILSLDFQGDAFLGAAELLTDPSLWPERVIVMTLGRVGSGGGPDLDRLRAIKAQAGARQVYAAGGTRDAADLETLATMGIAGALVATALHDGRIGAEALHALQSA